MASDDFYGFLQEVRERPSMFVLKHSLRDLEIMCHGYSVALLTHGIDEFGTKFNRRFSDFLRKKYKWSLSLGWAHAIRKHAKSDEQAFDRFFKLVDKFREEITNEVAHVVGHGRRSRST